MGAVAEFSWHITELNPRKFTFFFLPNVGVHCPQLFMLLTIFSGVYNPYVLYTHYNPYVLYTPNN